MFAHLLDKQADLTLADKDGWTPLHWASNRGKRTRFVFHVSHLIHY